MTTFEHIAGDFPKTFQMDGYRQHKNGPISYVCFYSEMFCTFSCKESGARYPATELITCLNPEYLVGEEAALNKIKKLFDLMGLVYTDLGTFKSHKDLPGSIEEHAISNKKNIEEHKEPINRKSTKTIDNKNNTIENNTKPTKLIENGGYIRSFYENSFLWVEFGGFFNKNALNKEIIRFLCKCAVLNEGFSSIEDFVKNNYLWKGGVFHRHYVPFFSDLTANCLKYADDGWNFEQNGIRNFLYSKFKV